MNEDLARRWTALRAAVAARVQALLLYLLARLQEASTWRGLVLVTTGGWGAADAQTQFDAIVSIGVFVAGMIGAIVPDARAVLVVRADSEPTS